MSKPTVTKEMKDRFKSYHDKNGAWGSLHIVLDDHNLATHHVEFCVEWAQKEGDREGEALAKILLQLTQTQRGKIAKEC